jgi:hypothetical protein
MPSKRVSYNFAQLDTDLLNNVKRRITQSGLVQFQNLTNIQSTIKPTQTRMDTIYTDIINFLNTMYQILLIIINASSELMKDIDDKIATDYTQVVTEFILKYDKSYTQLFNYFSPSQIQDIKTAFIRLDKIIDILTTDFLLGTTIYSFLDLLQNGLDTLLNDIMNASPINRELRETTDGSELSSEALSDNSSIFSNISSDVESDVEGGYIGGAILERRFM